MQFFQESIRSRMDLGEIRKREFKNTKSNKLKSFNFSPLALTHLLPLLVILRVLIWCSDSLSSVDMKCTVDFNSINKVPDLTNDLF